MGIEKILLILVLLVSVASAFVGIPYMGAIIAILGLVYGIMAVEDERRVYFLLVAVFLTTGAGAIGGIPAIGGHLTTILTTLGGIAGAAAIGVIGKGIAGRLM